MSDALIERFHPDYEGERIPLDNLYAILRLWIAETVTSTQAKTILGLSEGEATEFDALLGTAPADLSDLTGLLTPVASLGKNPRQEWSDWVRSVLIGLESRFSGFQTVAEVRSKLGLQTPA